MDFVIFTVLWSSGMWQCIAR